MTYREAINLPKIELHCHLDGFISQACLEFLLGRIISPQELDVSNHCDCLKTYLETFQLPIPPIQTADGLRAATFDLLRQASFQGETVKKLLFTDYQEFHIAGHDLAAAQITCVDSSCILERKE